MMKEVITLNVVPFDFQMKERMVRVQENVSVQKMKGETSDYYFITSPSVHLMYSYKEETGEIVLLSELTVLDVMDALVNPMFKSKLLSHIGN